MRTITVTAVTITAAAAILLLVGPAWAGGGGHGSSRCRTLSEGQLLAMHDNCFEGIVHDVDGGSTLKVTNFGRLPHTITAADGSFDSGSIEPGETFELDLEQTGDVPIYCKLHGTAEGTGMAGLLQVAGADTSQAKLASTSGGSAVPVPEGTAALVGVAIGVIAHRRWARRSSRTAGRGTA